MTESEWQSSTDPAAMLNHLHTSEHEDRWHSCVTDRKLRLFACACHLPRGRESVIFDYAAMQEDGQAARSESPGTVEYLARAWCQSGPQNPQQPTPVEKVALLRDIFGNPFRPAKIAPVSDYVPYSLPSPDPTIWFDPSWFTYHDGLIPKLAEAIYECRAFDRMPLLADALEEAGCEDEVILSHCRTTRIEVQGPLITTDSDECLYCKHWPANSLYGENGWVKCARWRPRPSYGTEYDEPGQPALSRCGRCRRVWEKGYDQVSVITYSTPLHCRGCWVLDLLTGRE